LTGERIRIRHNVGGRAFSDDFAPVNAGARPDIDDVIGGEDRVLVVFDNDDGVAEIA